MISLSSQELEAAHKFHIEEMRKEIDKLVSVSIEEDKKYAIKISETIQVRISPFRIPFLSIDTQETLAIF